MQNNMEFKIMTIRLPIELWKKLKFLIIEGKIKSIQSAIIDALQEYIEKL
jgi:hypothetical protein